MLYKIVKKIIRTNFSEIQENDYIKIFHKIIQDETLTQFIKQNIPEGEQELLRKFHILNQKNEIEKNISERDTKFLLELIEDKPKHISSNTLLILLEKYQSLKYSFIPELPLELALVEILGDE